MLAQRPEALTQAIRNNEALQRAIEAIRTPVIGGNWKMEVNTKETALDLLREIAAKTLNMTGVEIVIAPSPLHLDRVSTALKELETSGEVAKGTIKIAAQNIAGAEKGALTGRTGILQVKDMEVTWAIIGHSEQRRDKFDNLIPTENEAINNKVKLALKEGVVPIVCVGESLEERDNGKTKSIVEDMLTKDLDGLTQEQVAGLIIAYEPVWAIGEGKIPAEPWQAEEVMKFIRRFILNKFDEDTASKVRIIYGGSVKPKNIAGLMDKSVVPNSDGVLVGGASLKADSFISIVEGVSASRTSVAQEKDAQLLHNTATEISI